MAKSRWEIENQGFNQAPSRHGLEHICHHHANRLRIGGLLAILALTIERLYCLRYLRHGTHPLRSSAELFLTLGVNLFRPRPVDTPWHGDTLAGLRHNGISALENSACGRTDRPAHKIQSPLLLFLFAPSKLQKWLPDCQQAIAKARNQL